MAVLSAIEKQRYHRHLILNEIGEDGQRKLKEGRVLVVGAGGLGCPVIQYLTASGVGHLTIMDDDVVDMSNLQRQVFYGIKDVGKHKVIVAGTLMSKMNTDVNIEKLVLRAEYNNALDLVKKHDLVIDCTDNLKTRYVLSDACVIADKPLVHASVYKTQGQMTVFNYQGGPSYRCLFPKPEQDDPGDSQTLGIYSVLPGIFGLLQANEALKILIGMGEVQSGQMLILNILNNQYHQIKIKRNPDNFIIENLEKLFQKIN